MKRLTEGTHQTCDDLTNTNIEYLASLILEKNYLQSYVVLNRHTIYRV